MVLCRDFLLHNAKEAERNHDMMQWYEDLLAIAEEDDP
jgi:hypothetical protein